jgi:hypothetical protein
VDVVTALRSQALGALAQWSWPALVLAVIGRPRPMRSAWDRRLAAYGIACLALLVPAVLSPLDVRYLYALTPLVAVAAAEGLRLLWERGSSTRALALGLAATQAAIAVRGMAEAVLDRYR